MPLITGVLSRRRAFVGVSVQPSVIAASSVQPVPSPYDMNSTSMRGLIDTGAQGSLITRCAALRVGLKPRGKKPIGNVSSVEMHTGYLFVVGIWYDDNGVKGYYGFDPVLGADFKDNEDFDVLIGMDIISQGDFTAKRDGTFLWELP